jgi:UDP-glucose 4-epimerase
LPRPIAAPDQQRGETKLVVERALVHFERAYGLRSMALRFQRGGRRSDGEIGRDHAPRFIDPRAIRPRSAGRSSDLGDDYPTPDGTCCGLHHVWDLAEAHVKALESLVATRQSAAYNLGTGEPHSVRQVIEAVERVTGRRVPWTLGPRRPGDPAALYAAAHKARAELRWTPRFPGLDAIVRTAWEWHRTHPHGYGTPGHRADPADS